MEKKNQLFDVKQMVYAKYLKSLESSFLSSDSEEIFHVGLIQLAKKKKNHQLIILVIFRQMKILKAFKKMLLKNMGVMDFRITETR